MTTPKPVHELRADELAKLLRERALTHEELSEIVVRLARQNERLHDNDIDQHEDIRKALEMIRSTGAAIEALLREKYTVPRSEPLHAASEPTPPPAPKP